jgi:hypothetical protein
MQRLPVYLFKQQMLNTTDGRVTRKRNLIMSLLGLYFKMAKGPVRSHGLENGSVSLSWRHRAIKNVTTKISVEIDNPLILVVISFISTIGQQPQVVFFRFHYHE